MPPPRRLGSELEPLEDRCLPTAFGIPWADPGHLTLSFAADDTSTPLGPNTLAATLASAGSSAAWQREILRAFQTWAVNANIDVGLVADGGQALGSTGAVQGDVRFGDIRIVAAPLSSNEVAAAAPFSWSGTTYAGDVVFGSGRPFAVGNRSGAFDVYSVALHEAGHVLGLDHSETAESAVEEGYSYRTGLTAADIATLRTLYGSRQSDAFDAARSNGTASTASAIPQSPAGNGQLLAVGDITTTGDVDYYKFTTTPLLSALGVVVRLKASGISLLTPSVTVTDAFGRVVASGVSTDPLSNDVAVRFSSLFGGTFTIKVDGAKNDAFGVGGYKLAVDYLSLNRLLAPLTNTLGAVLDGHTDDLLATALGLNPPSSTDSRFEASYRGVIEDASDVDTYRVRTSQFTAGTPVTLNAIVWALDANPLNPRVRVYDAAGNPVAFQVLANDTGLFSVQVLNAVAGRDYFLQVAARMPGGANGTGAYYFGADFNQNAPTVFNHAAGDTLTSAAPADTGTLAITKAGIFQFALAADQFSGSGGAVSMTVLDAAGRVVFTLTASAGQPPVTTTQYLAEGTYTVQYRYSAAAGQTGGSIRYNLFLLQLSEGVGPYATTTTEEEPQESSFSSSYYYEGSSDEQPTMYAYYF